MYADYLSSNRQLNFCQEDATAYRVFIAEIFRDLITKTNIIPMTNEKDKE